MILCPQGLFLNDGRPCEDCIHGSFRHAVKKKCVKNSTLGSIIKSISWSFHRLIKVYEKVDAFVSPSAFMKTKMIEGGFPEKKVVHIPSFISVSGIDPVYDTGSFILYFGRLSAEKGVEILIDAYKQLHEPKPILLIIGDVDNYPEWVQNIKEKCHKIHFLSFQSRKALFE